VLTVSVLLSISDSVHSLKTWYLC